MTSSTEIWRLFLVFIFILGISLPLITFTFVVKRTQADVEPISKSVENFGKDQDSENSPQQPQFPIVVEGESKQGRDSDRSIQLKRDVIRRMTQEAWAAYREFAWGSNELKPVSQIGADDEIFGPGATIVDGLDTLLIMGLMEEYKDGLSWIRNHLKLDEYDNYVSIFEMNIRYLGSFLSLYSLTGDQLFLEKAVLVGDIIAVPFEEISIYPRPLMNMKTMDLRHHHWLPNDTFLLSELGTFRLEFEYLSDITGDRRFYEWAQNLDDHLVAMENGLYNNYVYSTNQGDMTLISIGGFGDSFYENLLKAGIMFEDENSLSRYHKAIDALENNGMFKRSSPTELVFIPELTGAGDTHKMDHLSCFIGAMLALGTNYDPSAQHYKTRTSPRNQRDLFLAEEITRTCRQGYDKSETKLGPEVMRFKQDNNRGATYEARGQYKEDVSYKLRPEYVESLFLLWRTTGNPMYRDWAWDVAIALKTYCQSRKGGGFSGLFNVYEATNSSSNMDDSQQSYFLAETLKYLYLIFSSDSLIDLDVWVFNTEGHPLPIRNNNPSYKIVAPKYTKIL